MNRGRFPLKKNNFIFLILFISSFIIYYSFLSKGPFHVDVLQTVEAIEKTQDSGLLHYRETGSGEPLMTFLGIIFTKIFRIFGEVDSVRALNIMACFFGSLGVATFYTLLKKILKNLFALYVSIILTFFPLYFSLSTFGKSNILSFSLSVLSFLFLYRYLLDDKEDFLLISFFLVGLLSALRIVDGLILYFVFSLASVIYKKDRRHLLKVSLYFFLILLIFYFPLFLDQGLERYKLELTSPYRAKFQIPPIPRTALKDTVFLFSPLGLILIALGMLKSFRRDRRLSIVFTLWPLIFLFLCGNVTTYSVRNLLPGFLPLFIFLGIGLEYLLKFRTRWFLLGAILGLFIYYDLRIIIPVVNFRHNYNLQKDFSEWIEKKVPPRGVIIAMDERDFLEYYTEREIIPRPITCNEEEIEDYFKNVIDRYLEEGREIYIITTAFVVYDPCGLFKKGLENNYRLEIIGRRLNEDWHHKSIKLGLFFESLYKIVPKV